MLFNSYIFIFLFLPLTITGWYFLNSFKREWISKVFLLGMSLWFYGYFNYNYLFIMIASIVINYLLYLLLNRIDVLFVRKLILIIGMALNIGVLFYYKYLGFFVENINTVFNTNFIVTKLLLPLGISFFTFQQVSFVIDSYKKTVPKYSFLDYALFVSFFPQLIAGPIVLHSEIIPQFADRSKKKFDYSNFSKGLSVFSFGMAKKVLIADSFGKIADVGFADIPSLDSTNSIVVMLAYTLQIYFDFSGYCDMATGIGLMFNIDLPSNFNSPYRAQDMNDFWKRWHMTLTRFLTQNVYIPLGGNRKGKIRTYINQFIVFLVSGIWHGANWTFVFWGMLNGLSVIFAKVFNKPLSFVKKKAKWLMWLLTFTFINLSWVYFRADSLSLATQMIKNIFVFDFGVIEQRFLNAFMSAEFETVLWVLEKLIANIAGPFKLILFVVFFGFSVFASIKLKNAKERLDIFKPNIKNLVISVSLLIWSVCSMSGVSSFLYFNF